jgi:hypothetical protein
VPGPYPGTHQGGDESICSRRHTHGMGTATVLGKSPLQGLHLGAQNKLLRLEDLRRRPPDFLLDGSILRLEVEKWDFQGLVSEKLDCWEVGP